VTALVSALFVDPKGTYAYRPDVDAWDESRDARNYRGPLPVVAHPPCGRWCALAKMVAGRYEHMPVGVDSGCFASAFQALWVFGGVLEHPAFSLAWPEYGLARPGVGAWTQHNRLGGVHTGHYWVCEVWQSVYGSAMRKRTWLIYRGTSMPPEMRWAREPGTAVVGHMSRRGDGTAFALAGRRPQNDSTHLTPAAFADALIQLAATSGGPRL
jgi:hypothetical protein